MGYCITLSIIIIILIVVINHIYTGWLVQVLKKYAVILQWSVSISQFENIYKFKKSSFKINQNNWLKIQEEAY